MLFSYVRGEQWFLSLIKQVFRKGFEHKIASVPGLALYLVSQVHWVHIKTITVCSNLNLRAEFRALSENQIFEYNLLLTVPHITTRMQADHISLCSFSLSLSLLRHVKKYTVPFLLCYKVILYIICVGHFCSINVLML